MWSSWLWGEWTSCHVFWTSNICQGLISPKQPIVVDHQIQTPWSEVLAADGLTFWRFDDECDADTGAGRQIFFWTLSCWAPCRWKLGDSWRKLNPTYKQERGTVYGLFDLLLCRVLQTLELSEWSAFWLEGHGLSGWTNLPTFHNPYQDYICLCSQLGSWVMRFFVIKVLRILQGPSRQHACHLQFGTSQLIPTETERPTWKRPLTPFQTPHTASAFEPCRLQFKLPWLRVSRHQKRWLWARWKWCYCQANSWCFLFSKDHFDCTFLLLLLLLLLLLVLSFFPESGREGFFQKKRCH